MSKSKSWAELPNWQMEEEYAFLDDASLAEWAWEFMRRHPAYRKDFEMSHGTARDLAGPKIYTPPMAAHETEGQYISRMVADDINYRITTFSQQCANKWGVIGMYDPSQPLSRPDLFQKTDHFPIVIDNLNDLEDFSLGEDIYDSEGNGIGTRVIPFDGISIVAFDLTKPLPDQLTEIRDKLEHLQKRSKKPLVEKESTSGQLSKWIRHLRVLDGLRSEPKGTYKRISEVLGVEKSSYDLETHEKRGERYINAAKNQMKNYRKILSHSPPKVSNKL